MSITILGIRHHGVGSAKNVVAMLKKIQPDIILVESPPELNAMTHLVGDKHLKPPVAVLCYDEAQPQRAVFYPLAEYSPEWQAMLYANTQKIPVRMMDLPIAIGWEMSAGLTDGLTDDGKKSLSSVYPSLVNPINYFSEIAGYSDAELWWEHNFETISRIEEPIQLGQPTQPENHFEAVMLMMSELRKAGIPSALEKENVFREAYMAHLMRQAQREMFSNIVVVCGAWHAPALLDLEKTEKAHEILLKKLPKTKIKVGVTWIPWTNDRLWMNSGYGAGITSPGWYGHLWKFPKDAGELWLTKVARLFREKKMDISTAHVIEAVRLTEALAGMRNLSRAGLFEMNEATQTVMCMGDEVLLELVRKDLIVGSVMGKVPDNIPKLPIQADFEEKVRQLRLAQTAEQKTQELDLRRDLDLSRSIFLHRLHILKIGWGNTKEKRGKGTFKEVWNLKWQPEMLVNLIEKGIYGNTIEQAATNLIIDKAGKSDISLSFLSTLIAQAIPSELFTAIETLLKKIDEVSSLSPDIQELMRAIVPLSDIARYGNVRKTDVSRINFLLESLLTRICIGLPNDCYGLDEETSQKMFELIRKVHEAILVGWSAGQLVSWYGNNFANSEQQTGRPADRQTKLDQPTNQLNSWFKTLEEIKDKNGVQSIIRGCTTRLLFDSQVLNADQTSLAFGFALSKGYEARAAAGWLEGFLKGSSMILLYDENLWQILYVWLEGLRSENFIELLPILRRTFSKYEAGERKKLGEKAKHGLKVTLEAHQPSLLPENLFDETLAEMPLPLLRQLLGLN